MKDKYLVDNILSNCEIFEYEDACLIHTSQFLSPDEADILFTKLKNELAWAQGEIYMFGKKVMEPRLSAWYGDEGKSYTYSGKLQHPLSWTADLLSLKNKIEHTTLPENTLLNNSKLQFNSVLANYYRNGNDSMGWHADDERELGQNPVIASVNLGETRRFLFRRKLDKTFKREIALTNGSLLIMAGAMQHFWQHAVPKEPKKVASRINLTFRWICS
jgi:alkylated DNA repair dioxygenase AlkB